MDFHRREQAGLWHVHFAGPFSICAIETAIELSIPVILTCHGQRDIDHLSKIQADTGRNLMESDMIKYVTTGSTDMCLAIEHARVPKRKIKRLPWGVDNNLFQNPLGKDSFREEIGIPTDRFVWITVARNAGVKNLGAILHMVRDVLDSGRSCVHWIAAGTEMSRLRKQVDSMDLSDHVTLYEPKNQPGRYDELPSPEIVRLLKCANGYISLSKSESFGIAVLEAMAAGLPIVASDISGHRDIVESDKNGILVNHNNIREVASAAKRVMNDATLINSLGGQARATARKFDWATTFTAFDALYNSVLSENIPASLSQLS